MATQVQWTVYMARFSGTKSDTQWNYRTKYERVSPSHPPIHPYHKKFMEIRTMLNKRGGGWPRTCEGSIDYVRKTFVFSFTRFILTNIRLLKLADSTVLIPAQELATLTKYISYRDSSQMLNQDEKGSQVWRKSWGWNIVLEDFHGSKKLNTHTMEKPGDLKVPMQSGITKRGQKWQEIK